MENKIEATKNRSSFNSSFDDSDNDISEDTPAYGDDDIKVHRVMTDAVRDVD